MSDRIGFPPGVFSIDCPTCLERPGRLGYSNDIPCDTCGGSGVVVNPKEAAAALSGAAPIDSEQLREWAREHGVPTPPGLDDGREP